MEDDYLSQALNIVGCMHELSVGIPYRIVTVGELDDAP